MQGGQAPEIYAAASAQPRLSVYIFDAPVQPLSKKGARPDKKLAFRFFYEICRGYRIGWENRLNYITSIGSGLYIPHLSLVETRTL
jgi:hypothetical protein